MTNEEQIDMLTDEAIARAHSAAPREWKEYAMDAVKYVCRSRGRGSFLTTDAVWARLAKTLGEDLAQPPEPRAMGGIIRWAKSEKWIRPTDRVKKSERPECHGRRITVWQVWKATHE